MAHDPIPVLVHCTVMVSAEQDEVGENGGPTVCPVLDMMGLDESSLASGEAAELIAM
jgi:hypothetical protein